MKECVECQESLTQMIAVPCLRLSEKTFICLRCLQSRVGSSGTFSQPPSMQPHPFFSARPSDGGQQHSYLTARESHQQPEASGGGGGGGGGVFQTPESSLRTRLPMNNNFFTPGNLSSHQSLDTFQKISLSEISATTIVQGSNLDSAAFAHRSSVHTGGGGNGTTCDRTAATHYHHHQPSSKVESQSRKHSMTNERMKTSCNEGPPLVKEFIAQRKSSASPNTIASPSSTSRLLSSHSSKVIIKHSSSVSSSSGGRGSVAGEKKKKQLLHPTDRSPIYFHSSAAREASDQSTSAALFLKTSQKTLKNNQQEQSTISASVRQKSKPKQQQGTDHHLSKNKTTARSSCSIHPGSSSSSSSTGQILNRKRPLLSDSVISQSISFEQQPQESMAQNKEILVEGSAANKLHESIDEKSRHPSLSEGIALAINKAAHRRSSEETSHQQQQESVLLLPLSRSKDVLPPGLFQIAERDSQQNSQRQHSIDTHFLSAVRWETLLEVKGAKDFNGRLKCSLHSDLVSLYCEKDAQLLCVSCLFDSISHTKHAVLPLQAAKQSILTNSAVYRTQLTARMQQLEDEMKKSLVNRSVLERTFERTLDTVAKEFHVLKHQVNLKQRQLEEQIAKSFDSAILKYDLLIADLKQLTAATSEVLRAQKNQLQESTVDSMVRDHFIFDTLLGTLNQARVQVTQVHKNDIDVLQIRCRQEFRSLVDEMASVRMLEDRHIGIKQIDSFPSRRSLVGSGASSPREKPRTLSRHRDSTSSTSPTRFNYVQKALQAHFASTKPPKQQGGSGGFPTSKSSSTYMQQAIAAGIAATAAPKKQVRVIRKPEGSSANLLDSTIGGGVAYLSVSKEKDQQIQQQHFLESHRSSKNNNNKKQGKNASSQASGIMRVRESNVNMTSQNSSAAAASSSSAVTSTHIPSVTAALGSINRVPSALRGSVWIKPTPCAGSSSTRSSNTAVFLSNKRFREQSGQSLSIN